jgi:hypothetical protein
MKKKVMILTLSLLSLVMLATPVLAIGPQNAENNPNVIFAPWGVVIVTPAGISNEWIHDAPVPIHVTWKDARDFKIKNAIVVTSTSEANVIENKWMYFSMEMFAAWISEKTGIPYPIMLGWASVNTPEGAYYKQVFVGK